MPLLLRWKCRYSMCFNYQSHCYIEAKLHYRVSTMIIGRWQEAISAGEATTEHMPRYLLLECELTVKLRAYRAQAKPVANQMQYLMQTWGGGPYWMAAQPTPFYPPMLAPFSPYFPQQTFGRPPGFPAPAPPLLPPPPTSSPSEPADQDPDELLKGYFDYLIKKYPLQAGGLAAAQSKVLKEAIDVDDFWRWLKEPERYPELASINQGL